jgi:transposase
MEGSAAELEDTTLNRSQAASHSACLLNYRYSTVQTIRLLLEDRKEESLTVYTDGFRAYEPLDEDDAFDRQYVVHGDGECADGDAHVNTCESHASLARRWLSPHRGISKDELTPYLRALQLRKQVRRKPGDEALKTILETAL